jgi:pimeloyl-ACP methyl ester carboxylesterase
VGLCVAIAVLAGCSNAEKPAFIPDKFSKRPQAFESHLATTLDGWKLSLFRYKPASVGKGKAPVILCHGLSYNAYFWDIDDEHSLAQYLAASGYDTWSVSLRGAGRSTKSGLSVIRNIITVTANMEDLPNQIAQTSFDFDKINWTVDDHATFDVPAIIDYVKKTTGSSRVNWVGHSMGGMLMYAYLPLGEQQENVNAFVAVGSPPVFPSPLNDVLEIFKKHPEIIKISNLAVARKASSFVEGMAGGDVPTHVNALFYSRPNMDRAVIQRIFFEATEDIAPGVLNQILESVRRGSFVSADGKRDYAEGIRKIRTPTLFIMGPLDNMAPPESVRYAYDNIAAREKALRLFGTINGYSANYGHSDLILGKSARKDVYPYIVNWLDKYPLPRD